MYQWVFFRLTTKAKIPKKIRKRSSKSLSKSNISYTCNIKRCDRRAVEMPHAQIINLDNQIAELFCFHLDPEMWTAVQLSGTRLKHGYPQVLKSAFYIPECV